MSKRCKSLENKEENKHKKFKKRQKTIEKH